MEANVLQDLSIIIAIAGITGIICSYLKFPILLGYMISGFIIGPNCFSHSMISNTETIEQLSELGVIFLMFYIGLEFDLVKLRKTLFPSLCMLAFEAVGMILIGCLIAPMYGWTGLNGIFIGSLLAISSTMTTFPILKSKNALHSQYGQYALGCLILDDVLAMLLLVVLSGIAVTGHFAWEAVSQVTFLVGIFVVVVFCLGKLLMPYFVRALQKIASPEIIAVCVIGIALSVGELAVSCKFSVALGAFLAGSIMSGSNLSSEIEAIITPFRNVFGAVFFTTIGMIINLGGLASQIGLIISLSFVIIVIRTLLCATGLFLTGKSARTSFLASITNAHIGEFSFIIASLGCSLGVVRPELMSVAVGTALVTITAAILLNKRSEKIFDFLALHTPNFLVEFGKFYHNLINISNAHFSKSEILKIVFKPVMKLVLWFFLLSGMLYATSYMSDLVYSGALESYEKFDKYGIMYPSIFMLAFFCCLPFLFGILKNVSAVIEILINNAITSIQSANVKAKTRVIGLFKTILFFVIVMFFMVAFFSATAKILPAGASIGAFAVISVVMIIVARNKILNINKNMELMFMMSFNNKVETHEQEEFRKLLNNATKNKNWDVFLKEAVVSHQSCVIGKKISEINLREKTGATIIAISRNNFTVYSFGPEMILFPHDKIILLGNNQQIEDAYKIISSECDEHISYDNHEEFNLFMFCIGKNTNFVGKSLSEAKFRNNYNLNVVGVKRGEENIIKLPATLLFEQNDILLLAGTKSSIEQFKNLFQ